MQLTKPKNWTSHFQAPTKNKRQLPMNSKLNPQLVSTIVQDVLMEFLFGSTSLVNQHYRRWELVERSFFVEGKKNSD